jgi:hypothetical protein
LPFFFQPEKIFFISVEMHHFLFSFSQLGAIDPAHGNRPTERGRMVGLFRAGDRSGRRQGLLQAVAAIDPFARLLKEVIINLS